MSPFKHCQGYFLALFPPASQHILCNSFHRLNSTPFKNVKCKIAKKPTSDPGRVNWNHSGPMSTCPPSDPPYTTNRPQVTEDVLQIRHRKLYFSYLGKKIRYVEKKKSSHLALYCCLYDNRLLVVVYKQFFSSVCPVCF